MEIKFILITFLSFLGFTTYCQRNLRRVDVSSLPKDISEIRDISLCVRWTDSTGDNVVITTEKIYRPSDYVVFGRTQRGLSGRSISDYSKESIPFVYHFMIRNDTAILLWRTGGSGMSCEVDTRGNKVKTSLIVTDLNHDKIAETWIVFKAVCVDDETPSAMKIIMYEQDKRHVQTGTRITNNEDNNLGGKYWFDESFTKAPVIFKQYAEMLWRKNLID